MGWKAVKDHYRIGHLVAFYEGEGLCIGSGYVHAIILIDPEKRTIREGTLGISGNADLRRYWEEFHSDTSKLWELLEHPDEFSRDLPVFTYEGGAVVEYQCEEYGYPNVTHCGQMMYENTFFEKEADARMAGIRNARAGVDALERAVERTQQDLIERQATLAEYRSNLARLLPAA